MNGADLLAQYRERQSDEAFSELANGYAGLVYSVARRQCHDNQLAEEVGQIVFTRLAASAPNLRTDGELAAWLHRTTVHVAIDAWRSEFRRRAREEKAAAMEPASAGDDATWSEIAPVLDQAINRLSAADRQAVLLRFF